MTMHELNDFWDALMRAYADLMITMDEAIAAYREAASELSDEPVDNPHSPA